MTHFILVSTRGGLDINTFYNPASAEKFCTDMDKFGIEYKMEVCALKDFSPDEQSKTEYGSFQELFEECKPLINPSVKYEPITSSNKKRVVRVTARGI